MWRDIGTYLLGFLDHWTFWFGIVLILLEVVKRVVGKPLERWPFWTLAVVCIFMATFQSWRGKNVELVSLQKKLAVPAFKGEIGAIGSDTRSDGTVAVLIGGVIKNPHGPPSGATDWKVQIDFPGGEKISTNIPVQSASDIHIPIKNNPSLLLPARNYWPGKTLDPIPAGGACDGWIIAVLPKGFPQEDLYKKRAICVVSFRDVVTGTTHSFDKAFGAENISIPH